MSPRKLQNYDEKTVLANISTALGESLLSMTEMWSELGVVGEARVIRLKTYESHVLDLLKDMCEEEEKNKQVVVEKIERLMQEAIELEKELCVQADLSLRKSEAPLFNIEQKFREELQKLWKLKEDRLEIFEELQRKEDHVLAALGQTAGFEHQTEAIYSEENLKAYESFILGKEAERERLQALFEDTRRAIKGIYDQLELEPCLPHERKLISASARSVILSSENMAELKALHQRLEQQMADAQEQAAELREKLSSLWERLQTSIDERGAFLDQHPGFSFKTIQALKKEVKRCEELKSANIAVFLKQLRNELLYWWDRCKLSNEQRMAFSPFYCGDCTEDMLDMFELEISKMRKFYEDHRDIFCLAEKRNELWEKMSELEQRASDPKRLFTNRGGQLLKEEKERKVIQKELPKIEQELLAYLEEYEASHLTPFLIDGYNLAEYIRNQWAERVDNKASLKQQRKVSKNPGTESRMGSRLTPNSHLKGSSSRTPNVAPKSSNAARSAPTRLASLKRKAIGTPLTENNNKKIKGGRKSQEKRRSGGPRFSTSSKARHSGKVASRNLDASIGGGKSSKIRCNIMSRLPVNESVAYSEFMDHLELMSSRTACRSSVMPQRCLRDHNSPARAPALAHPRPSPSPSCSSRIVLTPGRLAATSQLTEYVPIVTVTPMKPPRRNGTGIPTPLSRTRTSTRLNLKSPLSKSPASSTKLSTPRGRLPIII